MKAAVVLLLVVAFSAGQSVDNLDVAVNIVGGEEAKPGEFPYQATMFTKRFGKICNGVVLDERRVLTGAQCSYLYDLSEVEVRVGINSINEHEQQEAQIRRVSKIVVHEGWDYDLVINDILILYLDEPLVYKPEGSLGAVGPVKLPTKEDEFPAGTMAVISSFGHTLTTPTDHLLKVEIPIRSDEECAEVYEIPKYDSRYHIGAGIWGQGACYGDHGAPLVCGSEKILCGLASFGYTCSLASEPGIYTRITSYIDWINEN